MQVNIKQTATMTLHPLTETHPVMTKEQYEAFKLDIQNNGQLQPVLLYRGKIVDGRHRLRALLDLGISTILTTDLGNNLSLAQVRAKVISTEKRRHQSPTQLAIKGYREYKKGMKQADAVQATGCSLANLKHVVALESLGRLDLIDVLEKGGKVDIGPRGYLKYTDSLLGIVQWVKSEQKVSEAGFITSSEEEFYEGEPKPSINMHKILGIDMLTDNWEPAEIRALIATLSKKLSDS